jgi:hypothetical protein
MQPVLSISLDTLDQGRPRSAEQAREWCASLEAGAVLYFPQTPLPISDDDQEFLRGSSQTDSTLHKNIAYKPAQDKLSGMDAQADAATTQRLATFMRWYSQAVTSFLSTFLAPYKQGWLLDYASYRPIEEDGRDLPKHRRNDLLHTDAFPTRPTRGRRILRFFHNIHPSRTRDWMVGEPFAQIVGLFTPGKLSIPEPDSGLAATGKRLAALTGLTKIAPQWKRTPYDQFMHQLHNTMKDDEQFQRECVRHAFQFPAGSSWMVYTDTVPHAVLAGQYALEQTFLVDPEATVNPASAPVAVLEKLAGARLV